LGHGGEGVRQPLLKVADRLVSFPGHGTPDGPLYESRDVEEFAIPDMARRALKGMLPATPQGEKVRGWLA
jgi:hypothetical protein